MFRNVIATDDRAALEWTTTGTSNGDSVSSDGVSILETEGDKVRRFMAYFDAASPRMAVHVSPQATFVLTAAEILLRTFVRVT